MNILKLKRKLRFYYKNKVKVNLLTRDLKLKGTIISMPSLFKPYFDFKLEDNKLMQIDVEDLYPNSIYPESESIEVNTPSDNSKLRKSIPKSLKKDLWKNHFGNNFKGRCFCCKKEIMRDKFEVGHYISVANGGSDNLNNLRPICFDCNRSMGQINMQEFISQYYS